MNALCRCWWSRELWNQLYWVFCLSLVHPCIHVPRLWIGDNLDKTSPWHMRSDHQRRSIHYFHMYAALDRVNVIDLPADCAVGDIATTPLPAFLPSPADSKQLRKNSSWTYCGEEVAVLQRFWGLCCSPHSPQAFKCHEAQIVVSTHLLHLLHRYTSILLTTYRFHWAYFRMNENQMDEMVDILKTIQQKYVPVDTDGQMVRFQQTAFAGDQLTTARARKSQSVQAIGIWLACKSELHEGITCLSIHTVYICKSLLQTVYHC